MCTEDDPDATRKTKKRADAAGRDAEEAKQFREDFLGLGAGGAPVKAKPEKAAKPAKAQVEAVAKDTPPPLQLRETGPVRLQAGALTGYGSMEKGDITKEQAKARFAEIVMQVRGSRVPKAPATESVTPWRL